MEMLFNSVMKYCETNLREAKALVKTALFNSIMGPFRKAVKYQNSHCFYTFAIKAKIINTCWKLMQTET